MINRVVLVGRLTRDPELKRTANDVAVVSFTLAVNRQFTNSQGEREADFINCVIWRKAAENFAKFTSKGSLVGIDGRLQTRNYEKDGQRVYVTEVVVDNFSLLESKNASSSNNAHDNSNQAPSYNQSKNSNNNMSDPFAGNSKPIDISDDSLPF